LGSYVVASDEPAPGERLYFLKRIVQGSSQVLTSYAASPRPDDVVAQVRKYLQDSPPSFLATKSPIRIEDRITPDDERDASGQKHPSKTYAFQMASGVRYVINLTSTDFDAYLRLKDDQGVELARDDDSGGDLNAQITFQAPKDGIYRVVATSFNGKTGHFALTVGTEGRSPAAANVLRGPVRMEQELTANDATGAAIVGRGYRKTFSYQMTAGRKYVIDMVSNDFDSYLRLNDDQGKEVDHDDDSGGFPHARITYRAPRDGVYEIIATTFDGGKTGRFTLSVREES
jgi:hypothetical protein